MTIENEKAGNGDRSTADERLDASSNPQSAIRNPQSAIRKARTKDAIQIHALINKYAKEEQMLPRTLLSIYENIRDFYVAAEGDRVLGCSAL
ncbi:MAG TPA: hypothetical protein VG324_19270, partial [Blastocatellia bacterium]|nr:hypothetical protein [Blastocatellia bacterium]